MWWLYNCMTDTQLLTPKWLHMLYEIWKRIALQSQLCLLSPLWTSSRESFCLPVVYAHNWMQWHKVLDESVSAITSPHCSNCSLLKYPLRCVGCTTAWQRILNFWPQSDYTCYMRYGKGFSIIQEVLITSTYIFDRVLDDLILDNLVLDNGTPTICMTDTQLLTSKWL